MNIGDIYQMWLAMQMEAKSVYANEDHEDSLIQLKNIQGISL